jgi:transcriptional regulator with XRE-family HTH domain
MKQLYNNEFGEYLRKYRKRNELTQQQLADILDITMSHYGNVERGVKNPSIDLLIRISDKLNVSLDVLLKAESEYLSKQAANEYVERIQALPRKQREKLYEIIDIFLSLTENT